MKTPKPRKVLKKAFFSQEKNVKTISSESKKFSASKKINPKLNTGWGGVASWYEATVNEKFSYQKDLILPSLLKFVLRENFEAKSVLDIGCGNGFFMKEFAKFKPYKIVGVDIDEELLVNTIEAIKEIPGEIEARAQMLSANDLNKLEEKNFDLLFAIESLVNMQYLDTAAKNIASKMHGGSSFFAVVNHPSFRVPQESDWYYDETKKAQGRVVYHYKTSKTIKIDMNPGSKANKKYTYTFHRSMEEYVNIFAENGMYLKKIREVCSNKKSGTGPRQVAEDNARNEIPLFLFMEFVKN